MWNLYGTFPATNATRKFRENELAPDFVCVKSDERNIRKEGVHPDMDFMPFPVRY